MGSSGGSANPAFLSQGGTPMPGIPIAGQGELKPQERGSYQEFLPEIAPAGRPGYQIMPAGQGPNPSATGLTAEMFRYRSPTGILAPGSGSSGDAGAGAAAAAGGGGDIAAMKQQLAALQAQGGQPQGPGFGQFNQQGSTGFPQNWTNSNVPWATS